LGAIVDIQLNRVDKRLADQQVDVGRGRRRAGVPWPRLGTIRSSARARSSVPSSSTCSTRWRLKLLDGDFKPGDDAIAAEGQARLGGVFD
jgi:hypothetical protein